MVPKSAVTVLGQPPFHDTDLTASGRLSYLGGNWDRDIAFAGYSIPLQACDKLLLNARQMPCASQICTDNLQQRRLDNFLAHIVMPNTLPWHIGGFPHALTYILCLQGDMPAGQMINSLPGVDPARRDKVLQVLDIDLEWRMHKVSDGQRRRVQICMGLLKPPEVRLCHLKSFTGC